MKEATTTTTNPIDVVARWRQAEPPGRTNTAVGALLAAAYAAAAGREPGIDGDTAALVAFVSVVADAVAITAAATGRDRGVTWALVVEAAGQLGEPARRGRR